MDRVRWGRIQTLFQEAVDRPAAEQRAYLLAACPDDPSLVAELLAMLAEDAAHDSLLNEDLAMITEDLFRTPLPGSFDATEFLPYRITASLGEGGMGVVFLAQRDDVGLQVAIKLLRDAWVSPDRRQRFVDEQRTLAQLSHPGIARLYDARTLRDGTPWFVMEYVDGIPLNEYSTRQQCSVEERVRLFRAVCEAVQHAHEHGVIHRDLKPSNILVKADGSLRLLDFGISKQLDPTTDRARTTMPFMTPAYAAPEQLRGKRAAVATDVYSLGVVLYELLTGRLPVLWSDRFTAGLGPPTAVTRPSVAAKESPDEWRARLAHSDPLVRRDLDGICLTALHEDPARRYQTVTALIRDLDHVRDHEPIEAQADPLSYTTRRWLRRRWKTVAAGAGLVVVGGTLAAMASITSNRGRVRAAAAASRTVAVMPFVNAHADSSLEYLRLSLADEIATTLGIRRGLTVRPFTSTSQFTDDTLDYGKVGRAIGVASVVTGRLERQGTQTLIALQALDVATNRIVWQDRLTVTPGHLIALRAIIATRAAGGLASALGAAAPPPSEATRPHNEEAYALYLRTAGERLEPGPRNTRAIAMLERAVVLDSSYAPAWLALSRRYYLSARFETGDAKLFAKAREAGEQAIRMDPDYVVAGARQIIFLVEAGELGRAYRNARNLIRRRPESPDGHFALSYVLRYAGLLEEAVRECSVAISNDPYNFGWRTCAIPSILLGDNEGAMGFLGLDQGGEFTKALTVHMLVRSGKEREALAMTPPQVTQWTSYGALLACVARKPAAEIDRLVALVHPDSDPETNYFAASHLAYCGKTSEALELLALAIRGRYCSYPLITRDPYFARLRELPAFDAIRAEGAKCQATFLADAGRS